MEVFRWVVELGSFSKAADRLDLSKATITTHIASLESRLGVRLLNRTTRRLALTDDGAAYLDHVRRVLADVEETDAILSAGRSVPRGILRVDLPIAILEDRRIDLLEEGVDAALRIGRLADSSLIARRVYDMGWVLCASSDYLG